MLFNITGRPPLYIEKAAYDEMLLHAKEAYPHECCGVLVGSGLKDKRVFQSHRVKNTNTDRAKDRYNIDPVEIHIIDRSARAEGLDVLGFYHSHPDHPDRPSEYDREWGQVGYSYVIVSVMNGKDVSVKSWVIADEKDPYKEEKIKVTEP
ncbi:MAG: M67 family metallopeptidase [Deltaproteobacteria bacterium]|nr:M67 family metallopeptidase [Deltaproteobacteria bacterium]